MRVCLSSKNTCQSAATFWYIHRCLWTDWQQGRNVLLFPERRGMMCYNGDGIIDRPEKGVLS